MPTTSPADLPAALPELSSLVAWFLATGALGTAAFGLVDATKAFRGGVSLFGLRLLTDALAPFAAALDAALGADVWRAVVRAHWIDGRPAQHQKAVVRSLVRLGLNDRTAAALAASAHVDPDALTAVARKLAAGTELDPADVNVIGRLDASVETRLDAAYAEADQRYRNAARILAGLVAIALAITAAWHVGQPWYVGAFVGLLAVPISPIAKDIASSLSAAARAVKLRPTA